MLVSLDDIIFLFPFKRGFGYCQSYGRYRHNVFQVDVCRLIVQESELGCSALSWR